MEFPTLHKFKVIFIFSTVQTDKLYEIHSQTVILEMALHIDIVSRVCDGMVEDRHASPIWMLYLFVIYSFQFCMYGIVHTYMRMFVFLVSVVILQ